MDFVKSLIFVIKYYTKFASINYFQKKPLKILTGEKFN